MRGRGRTWRLGRNARSRVPSCPFHHPQVGTLTLTSQSLHVEGTPGRRIGVYTAEPGTPDHDALLLLDMTAPRPAQGLTPAPKSTRQQL
ncbi:hypothetical protein ABZ725_42110 [Streptomyces sp. NPDC006872]|uniref:MmyB family transcriptional regulator n=1 Tax=Streptomyces sp. NPDC006872 TaxID=3155720 RepID=UPI00340D2D71